MKLKDHVAYLQTLPQDLECWFTWDEGGDCHPCEKNQGKVVHVGEEDVLEHFKVNIVFYCFG